jgi:hypothetical protein
MVSKFCLDPGQGRFYNASVCSDAVLYTVLYSNNMTVALERDCIKTLKIKISDGAFCDFVYIFYSVIQRGKHFNK